MGFHLDNFSLTHYLRNTAAELIEPIETIEWELWEVGEDTPDGLNTIYAGLFAIALHLASVDNDISIDEIELFHEIRTIFQDVDVSLSSHEWCEIYKVVLRDKPNFFCELGTPPAISYLVIYDQQNGTSYAEKARVMYFRFANAIVKADGKITEQEEAALHDVKNSLYNQQITSTVKEKESIEEAHFTFSAEEKSCSLDESLQELNSLIGLEAVKNDVLQLVNFLKIQQMRESRGMATVPVSRHLVFYGNPGTGKTTVARLLAQIYKSLNLISRGHLVETDRSGLVAGYVGQTALKVNEIISTALGGILFIDEAYALAGEGQDYGCEAIDTLIKLMEDNRDDLIVVVAGYTNKMNKFLLSNPGLKSRFNKFFSFEDYSPVQLVDIFELFCNKSGFKLTAEARDKLLGIFQLLHDVRDETFGNARLARNVFEQSINNQANRIIALSDISEETLSAIYAQDIPGEVEIHTIKV